MSRSAALPSLPGQKQSLNGQKQRPRMLHVLFARAKTLCAVVIALVLLLQFHSFVYRHMDDEALRYRCVNISRHPLIAISVLLYTCFMILYADNLQSVTT